jgi:hypothetical protein
MPYLNKGAAIVLPRETPSSYEVMQDLQRQNQLHQQIQEKKQQEEQGRQNALITYMGQNFDPSDFDGLLGQQLQSVRTKYAQLIKDNPYMNNADLTLAMQKDLGKLSQWNQGIKMGREAIKQQAEAYKGMKGVDYGGAEKAALNNFLFKKGEDGKPQLRGADDLQSPDGIVHKTIYDNPNLFVTDGADIWDDLKNTQVSTEGKTYKYTDSRKGQRDKEYSISYYQPYQKIVHADGSDPKVVTKSTQAKGLDGSPMFEKGENGSKVPMMIADDEAYQHYISNPMRELTLRKKYMQTPEAKQFSPDSPAGEILMRKMALKDIESLNPVKKEVRDITKEQPVINIHNSGNGSGSGSSKGDVDINDLYHQIKSVNVEITHGKIKATPFNELPIAAQTTLMNLARNQKGVDPTSINVLNNEDLYIKKDANGNPVALMKASKKREPNEDDEQIAPLSFKDVNLMKGVNSSVKERQQVLHKSEDQQQPKPAFVFPGGKPKKF